MRQVKLFSQFAVMWVVVFVMAAGPLPLGIPRAEAAGPSVTDLPGLQNFYTPKVFIIFDTSKSMQFRPNDPNSDPTAAGDDWDPTTPSADCRNKFCIGKRALYRTLPKYTPRIELGLSGYNQYYQLTTRPSTLGTNCKYDRMALSYSTWGIYKFPWPVLEDIDVPPTGPTGPTGLAATPFPYVPPRLTDPHSTRRWSVGTDEIGKNVGNGPGGAGSTMTITVAAGTRSSAPSGAVSLSGGTFDYAWNRTIPNAGTQSIVQSGATCPASYTAYNAGNCAGDPCDLTLYGGHTQAVSSFVSGVDLGTPYTWSGVTYDAVGPTTVPFTESCSIPSTYTGPAAGCDSVYSGCAVTKTGGPTTVPSGAPVAFYDSTYNPGAGWVSLGTTTDTLDVQIVTYGLDCLPVGTTVTSTGSTGWESLATGGWGPGLAGPTPNTCSTLPGMTCTWKAIGDYVQPGETNKHFCQFQRNVYQWQNTTQQCDYTTQTWTYNPRSGIPYCDYKFDRDIYSRPSYTYSYLPNDGDLLGGTNWDYIGNDDIGNYPTAVTYTAGSFSNGDCPNLVSGSASHPQCSNGVVCKLTWTDNTTIAGVNYPRGRYTGIVGGPWQPPLFPPAPYKTVETPTTLVDPNWPPTPFDYVADWGSTIGAKDAYWETLMANYYDTSDTNPPNPPLFLDPSVCPNCTYQYAYKEPAGLTISPTTFQVDAITQPLAPAAFSAVATTMPASRSSGWAQLPDQVTAAISWQGVALNDALYGATPSADGPLLRMLSKYDRVNNPAGLQMPDFGDYTPLTGSLKNVADYLKSYLDTDPYAGCGRRYYVLLVTDGEEQPPLPGNDPVGAVRALRTLTSAGGITVDVKTFVIGFGISSAQLNAMAREGGTSVSPSDPGVPDLTSGGVAFSSLDEAGLFRSLEISFGKILSGYFTRSKPVVNVLGTEMYVGYMRVLQGLEWQGKLDSIDIKTASLPTLDDTLTSDGSYRYLWRYGDMIDAQATRNVYTSLNPLAPGGNRIWFDYSGCSGGTHTCTSAAGWNTNTGADQNALENLIDSSSPSVAKETIAFLLNKGAQSVDGGTPVAPETFDDGITPKLSRASDIFHAVPAVVEGAAQSTTWPDPTEAAGYQAFRNDPTIANREKTVYIGANDGMLHAVRDNVDSISGPSPIPLAGAGEERWGYVPFQLLPRLKNMRHGHDYGVDGSVGVADVCGPGFSASACTVKDGWRTLLVGALGKGGAGLYALDITDPADPQVKWERSNPMTMLGSRGYLPRFGETWGPPVIARTEISSGKPWSVFVGGGVVPGVDGSEAWGNLFFVLDARDGSILADGAKSARYTITDDPLDPTVNGVASRPTLFRPGDSAIARKVYFTDVEGKIWRMNLASSDMDTWAPGSTPFFDPVGGTGVCNIDINGNPTPILDATTGVQVTMSSVGVTLPLTTRPRPKIYNRPMAAIDTTGSLNVYVGTGDSDNPGALGAYDYLYGLADSGGSSCATPLFVLRFSQSEKVLAEPAFLNNTIFVTTYLPVTDVSRVCEVGRGFLYSFDAHTGLPVAALKDPFNSNLPVSKLDLGDVRNSQLKQGGIPSAPIIRGNKLYVANELDPSHPRQIDLVGSPLSVKVRGWQRVK